MTSNSREANLVKAQTQRGSAHVLIIVILVVALVAALGWIFYQNFILKLQVKTGAGVIVASKNEDEEVQSHAKPLYEGKRIHTLGGAYSVKVPNGWVLINNNTNDQSFGKDYLTTGPGLGMGAKDRSGKITYKESVSPVIKEEQLGGWDGFAEIFSISTEKYATDNKAKDESFKLDDGTVGTRYESVAVADPDREVYATEHDFYTYQYVFKKNQKTVQAVYSVFENHKSKYDQTLIENVVRSIEIQ